MTQQELASDLGVQQSTVSKWLRGDHLPVGLTKQALMDKHPEIYKQILAIYEEKHAND